MDSELGEIGTPGATVSCLVPPGFLLTEMGIYRIDFLPLGHDV